MTQRRTTRTPSPRWTGVALVALLALAACGSEPVEDGRPADDRPATEGAWTQQDLPGDPGPDHPWLLAVDSDQVLVGFATDQGGLHGWTAEGDDELTTADPLATGVEYLGLGGAARVGDRWLAVGSGGRVGEPPADEIVADLHAYASDDGRTWEAVETTGLDEQADVAAVAAVQDRVSLVGTLRTAEDPSDGGFVAAAWTSADGQAWTRAELPVPDGGESSVQDLVVIGDELLATGRAGSRALLWRSTDGGTTWAVIDPQGVPAGTDLAHLAVAGDVVVAGASVPSDEPEAEDLGEGARQAVLRSTDGGTTWAEAEAGPPSGGESYAPAVHAAGGRFFTTRRGSSDTTWSDPAVCYADLAACTDEPTTTLYASDDGSAWRPVDTSGLDLPSYAQVDAVVGSATGPVRLLARTERGIAAWSWPAGVELPEGEEPPPPERADLTTLAEGMEAEEGVRYALPLYVHCGMDWLYLGDQPWQRTDDGPDLETGAGDPAEEGWPVAGQTIFGFATVVSPGVLEYSIGDDEVIATYGPPTEEPPMCA